MVRCPYCTKYYVTLRKCLVHMDHCKNKDHYMNGKPRSKEAQERARRWLITGEKEQTKN